MMGTGIERWRLMAVLRFVYCINWDDFVYYAALEVVCRARGIEAT